MTARRERADAGVLLVRALIADAAAAGCTAREVSATAHDWASATFVGMRHRIVLAVTGDADRWARALPEAEFRMWRHIVADLVVEAMESAGEERQVTIAALTLLAA
jgi:hypothetical protein